MRQFLAARKKVTLLIQDDKQRLMHYAVSTVIFFISYGMLYWCATHIAPSLQQELILLACLIIGGIAFFWAMMMQVFFILSRLSK